ncbi:hypothetical protein G7Y79_00035g070440 [Physcia stellaris]|nr:hypothetical protein G7Y79_00035g070440 [Physcia stellaris]
MVAAVTGWWMTIEPAFSLGTISAILTLVLFIPFFWYVWIKPVRREIAGGSLVYMYTCFVFAVSRDFIMQKLCASVRPPPYSAWVFGAICAALEAVIYAGTTYYLFLLYATAMPNRIPIETI